MGSKGGTTQQTSSSSSPPPQVMAEYQGLVDRATNVANQPYQPYTGEMVAPLSSQTLAGLGGVNQYANAAQPYLQSAAQQTAGAVQGAQQPLESAMGQTTGSAQGAQGMTLGAYGSAQPYLGAASGMTLGASGAVNPQQYQGLGSLAPYMNPYTQSVVNATEAEMNNQNQQQGQFLNSANISSGAFGGDRAGIGQSILANQQQLAEAPTIAGLNQANYTQAMQNWQQQQGVNLGAQQANQARLMSGANQLAQLGLSDAQLGMTGANQYGTLGMSGANQLGQLATGQANLGLSGAAQTGQIGETMQQAGLQGAQSQLQAGMIPQEEQQAIDTAAQQQYQTGQAYPFTTTGWLGNIIEGTGAQSGGTSQTTAPGPNSLTGTVGAVGQGLGLMSSLLGLSDVRAKENVEPIGKTYDGQNIYRYNFKGDPRTQIGLLAQEEAYRDPGNVKRVGMGDLLGIDYEGATDEAAERGHFQYGGAPGGAMPMAQQPQQQQASARPAGMSPDMTLMMEGDPGARMGMGSYGLLGGTNVRPQPMTALAQPRQGFQSGGEVPLGPGGALGYGTPGFVPGVDPVSPQAGVSETLYGDITAGSKAPYAGIDTDQIAAIGGGEWLPPVTGTPMPDWNNLQNSTQYGSAEASLKGLFGPGYTPGAAANQSLPANQPSPPAAAQPSAAANPAQWGINNAMIGGMLQQASQPAPDTGGFHGNEGGVQNATAMGNALDLQARNNAAYGQGGYGPGYWGGPGLAQAMAGNLPPGTLNPNMDSQQALAAINAFGAKQGAAHGGKIVNQRAGFQGGGAPGYYVPTTGIGRGPATWVQPQPQAPPAIQIQRQLQGQARARAAVQRGMTRPTHIVRTVAPDPVTGDLHDMHRPVSLPMSHSIGGRPLDPGDRPPFGTGPYSPGGGPPDPTAAMGGPPPRTMAKPWPWPSGAGPQQATDAARAPPEDPTGSSVELSPRSPSPSELTPEFSPGSAIGSAIRGGLRRVPLVGQAIDMMTPSDQLAPPSRDEAPPWSWKGGPPPADTDSDVMRMGDEGPQRFRGGRIGRQDGGNIPIGGGAGNVMEAPTGTPSDDDNPLSGLNLDRLFSGLSDADFTDMGDTRPARAQVDPRAVAQAPTFTGGGGGGGGYRGDVTSLMGGPPITAGHFTPTTGNARGPATFVPGSGGGAGAGISPNARAQAPEHPAVTMARHIMRQHAARNQGIMDPEIVARQRAYNSWVPPNSGYLGGANTPASGLSLPDTISQATWPGPDRFQGFQGGGGVMGASPVQNAGGYVPQGAGMVGQTSQGGGLGSIATAKGAAGGFGDLFGGSGRQGFQEGGGTSGQDPLLAAIEASSKGGGGGGGKGPPQPPEPPKPPSGGGGPGDLSGPLGKLGDAVKKTFAPGQQQGQPSAGPTTPSADPNDVSGGAGNMVGTPNLDDATLGADDFSRGDFGFQAGGGVGLGSLRGNFQDGGNAAAADALDQALTTDAGPVAAPAGGGQGGGGGGQGGGRAPAVPDLINQYFGDRAGYASTIATRESGMGKAYVGDGGSSFGPFQLHYGGINKDMPHPGLGDEFTKQTGLDARDPSTVQDQIKFVSNWTAKHGWNDWSTAKQDNPGPGGSGSNVPSAGAQPAQASTTSYGGGFQLPPGGYSGGPPPGQLDRSNLQAPTMGDELRHDPGGYLMSVGSAMMASRAPRFMTGLGEGFEAGNKYLQGQMELEKSWGATQAQINNLSQEARDKGADADLKVQQLQLTSMQTKLYMDELRRQGIIGGSADPGATGGQGTGIGALPALGPVGTPTAASGAPGGGAAPSGGAAPAPTGGAAPAAPTGGADQPPSLSADQRWQQGQKLLSDAGLLGNTPLGLEKKAQGQALVDAATSDYNLKKEQYDKTVGATTEAQKPVLQSYLENREKFESTYDQTRSEISELSNIYQHFQAGRASDAKAELASWANEFGFKFDQAASADAAMKSAIQQAFAAVANSGLQKAPRAGLKEATMMVASPTRDPAALRKILTDQLATLDYQHDMYQNVPGHNLNVGDDMDAFTRKSKYSDYLNKARSEIPMFKGITPETLKNVTGEDWPAPLPKQGAVPGQRYSLPNGKVVRAQPNGTFQVEYEP